MTWWHPILLWFVANGALVVYYRRDLLRLWREPVFRHPILIVESDDWGAGPVETQAAALNQLVELLTRYGDCRGRHPVMTLAMVLAVPDGPAIRRDGQYQRRTLEDPIFDPVREAIDHGRAAGVFALQLHGLEHYWPDALMASQSPIVKAWLEGDLPATTELLPSHLQSRWVDATVLPSRPLPSALVAGAVAEEVRIYERVFGERPHVAVPPTFVWNDEVERSWAQEGVEFVVTPGLRSACRNADGLPDCDTGPIVNGQRGSGVAYVVRDDYFEPERGHRAERPLAALASKTEQGRPCLLETHRSNFIAERASVDSALAEIGELYLRALKQHPNVRFLSTLELGQVMREGSADWVERDVSRRVSAWILRARRLSAFSRAARLTGLQWLMQRMRLLIHSDYTKHG